MVVELLGKFLSLVLSAPAWWKMSFGVWAIAGIFLLILYPGKQSSPLNQVSANDDHQPAPTAASRAHLQTNGVQFSSPVSQPTTKITVEEIIDAVLAAPPLQQNEVEKTFIGVEVEWIGFLDRAEFARSNPTQAKVILHINNNWLVPYRIFFSVDVEARPEWQSLKRNSKVRVRGRISAVRSQGLGVELDPSEVDVVDRAVK